MVFSAPMCDAHLVVAKTEQDGLACFFVPALAGGWNQEPNSYPTLKDKVGNQITQLQKSEFKGRGAS